MNERNPEVASNIVKTMDQWTAIYRTLVGGLLLSAVYSLFTLNNTVTQQGERLYALSVAFERRVITVDRQLERIDDRIETGIKECLSRVAQARGDKGVTMPLPPIPGN